MRCSFFPLQFWFSIRRDYLYYASLYLLIGHSNLYALRQASAPSRWDICSTEAMKFNPAVSLSTQRYLLASSHPKFFTIPSNIGCFSPAIDISRLLDNRLPFLRSSSINDIKSIALSKKYIFCIDSEYLLGELVSILYPAVFTVFLYPFKPIIGIT